MCVFASAHTCLGPQVTGVEMFKKNLSQGQAGDNVGLLIRGIKREDVSRGQVVARAGTVKTYTVGQSV